MLRFMIRRLLVTIPMILVVITLTWGLIRLAPGNFYSGEKKIPKAVEKNIREKYGLNKPWYVQYGRTMGHIVRLDFGDSLKYQGQSVNTIIARSLPVSAIVGILAYLLALIVGITVGSIAALKQNSKWDYASMALAMLGISIPNFVLGPLLVLLFSLALYWLPPSRWSGFPSRSVVLPVLTLSAIYMAYIARLTRAGMLERSAREGRSDQACAPRRNNAGCFVYRTGAGVSLDRHGGGRTNLCAARLGELFYSSIVEPRRAVDTRNRRLHRDDAFDHESTGRYRVRVSGSAHTLLTTWKTNGH